MRILQLALTGGIILSIILVIFAFYFLISLIVCGKEINKLKKKKKYKKQKRKITFLQRDFKKTINKFVVIVFLTSLVIGGSWYISYYQSTNLSTNDMTNITDAYYYLSDLKDELETIQSGKADNEKSQQTINFIVASLASYSTKKANTLNTIDGQSVLNRYYNALSELGINTSRNASRLMTDPDLLTESLSDIDKVQNYQKKALDYYKVDTSALESKK